MNGIDLIVNGKQITLECAVIGLKAEHPDILDYMNQSPEEREKTDSAVCGRTFLRDREEDSAFGGDY